MSQNRRQYLQSALLLLVVIGITAGLFIFRHSFERMPAVGYPVLFFLSILANASLILPLPGVALASVMGANPSFTPWAVAIAVGSGAAVGEMTGYMAGVSGRAVIQRADWYSRILDWMRKYGGVTIFLLALIPNPLFDLAGISAGALRLPVARFLFWCCLGKICKMLVFAYAGAQMMQWFPWLGAW